ncbi:MAG TPA: thiamine phosphate synthase [Acidobacteriaceae bacterium]|jgi:thiamine-phosphate pyrophosphorylase|nr:thiamine phosphate synthase [Acidobacteriaceae bacterium]
MIPRLYAIIDAGILSARGISIATIAHELREAGVELIQYRDKTGAPQQVLEAVALVRAAFAGTTCQLILNDRADLAALANADGVHVGQDDLSPADVRAVLGPRKLIGLSTHNDQQVQAADQTGAGYIAIGPVFSTGTKLNPDPVIGLEGVRRARALTTKPLVAIGGITRDNALSVIQAGADSVAVISGLLSPDEATIKIARDFLDILR